MAFYIALAALLTLLALPLEVSAELVMGETQGMRIAASLAGLKAEFMLRLVKADGAYAVEFRRGRKPVCVRTISDIKRQSKAVQTDMSGAIKLGAARLMRYIRVERAAFYIKLGVGDAAAGAILCGVIEILISGVCAAAGVRPEIELKPDFENMIFAASAEGIFRVKVGHIIGAALAGMAEYCREVFTKWKTQKALIRSRA